MAGAGIGSSPRVDSHFEISPGVWGGELTASLRTTRLWLVMVTTRWLRKVVLGLAGRPPQPVGPRSCTWPDRASQAPSTGSQLGPASPTAEAPGHTFPREPLRGGPDPAALARKGHF